MIHQHPPEAPQDEFQRLLAERDAAQRMFDWADTAHIDVAIRHLASVEEALAVAVRLGRRAIGIELNPDYLRLIEQRMADVRVRQISLFADEGVPSPSPEEEALP